MSGIGSPDGTWRSLFGACVAMVATAGLASGHLGCGRDEPGSDDERDEGRSGGGDADAVVGDLSGGEVEGREAGGEPDVPRSSLQPCLCYPTGERCDHRQVPFFKDEDGDGVRDDFDDDGEPDAFVDPGMACPEGEVCDGGYYAGAHLLLEAEGRVGVCRRSCASGAGFGPGDQALCSADEDCAAMALRVYRPHVEVVGYAPMCVTPSELHDFPDGPPPPPDKDD